MNLPQLKTRRQFNHVHDHKHNIPDAQQINDPAGRYYTIDGKRYPSITTMLGYFTAKDIQKWRNRIGHDEANKISAKASLRGTKFHKICETYLLNEEPTFKTPLEQQLFINTQNYIDLIDDVHLLEQKLYSHHLRLAGTVDCIAAYDGRLSVVDFKTSTRTKAKNAIDNYFMQASGYAIMYEELTNVPVPQIVIIMAVEGEPTQCFVEKRDNFAKQLIKHRDLYEANNQR